MKFRNSLPSIRLAPAKGYLYFVADSHLDEEVAPYGEFIAMLDALEAPSAVVCLGDLFKVWLALPVFWKPMHHEVMAAFRRLQQRGSMVIFVVGNREVLLPRRLTARWRKSFPFDVLVRDSAELIWGEARYGIMHGDTINRHDLNYLRWRKLARSRVFEYFFRGLPTGYARKLAEFLEAKLAGSNRAFKIYFPEAEALAFAQEALAGDRTGYFIGHFHLDQELRVPEHPGFLRIVPDWLAQRAVVRLDAQGQSATLYFPSRQRPSQ